jgi:uncharacterized membrane protein (UPF0127 family)
MAQSKFKQTAIWAGSGGLIMAVYLLLIAMFGHYTIKPMNLAHTKISIAHAEGGRVVNFDAEIALTDQEKARGLMYRQTMPRDAGMIFLWNADEAISFWMKNTYIPLDMLFIRYDGTIVKIVTHAMPRSLSPIPSDQPIRAVLEVNADVVDENAIKIGDKVIMDGVFPTP